MCYPKGGVIRICLCFWWHTILCRCSKSAIAVEHGRDKLDELSHYSMALEIAQATDGMLVAIPEHRWTESATMPCEKFTEQLREIVGPMKLSDYRKSKRGPRKPPPKRINGSKKTHLSVKRILDERKNTL